MLLHFRSLRYNVSDRCFKLPNFFVFNLASEIVKSRNHCPRESDRFSFNKSRNRAISRIHSNRDDLIQEFLTGQPKFESPKMNFIDIGCNLLDAMYKGQYNGKMYHDNDLTAVLERARAAGIRKMIVTAGNLEEAKEALALCQGSDDLFCTAGVHPTRAKEWSSFVDGPEKYMEELCKVIEQGIADGKVVAIGECGLDYDRLQFCDEKTQQECFLAHFALSQRYNLPMFLHLRSAGGDFMKILEENYDTSLPGGVVHSFDGSFEELNSLLKYDSIFIGINGCSLKTEDNLSVARSVPLERLMLETDAPWCSIRPTHASSSFVKTKVLAKDKKKHSTSLQVKGRNEPCNIIEVLEVISGLSGLEKEVVAEHAYENAEKLFF